MIYDHRDSQWFCFYFRNCLPSLIYTWNSKSKGLNEDIPNRKFINTKYPQKKKTKLERFHINYLMVTSEALEKQDQTTHQKT